MSHHSDRYESKNDNVPSDLRPYRSEPNILFHEAYRRIQNHERTLEQHTHLQPGSEGRTFRLMHLDHRTGNHKTADAMVYVPDGFDPRQPVKVMVYNHGFGTNAQRAFHDSLAKQMTGADHNTVFIVPEWQTVPDSRTSSADAKFNGLHFFKDMLQEIMTKTPPLQSLKVDDVASFGIITHSAGYVPATSELYRNGLFDKVTSLTVLDSLYNPRAFDGWIEQNIGDLATGKKQLQVIYTDHLAKESLALAHRVRQSLQKHDLSEAGLYIDHGVSRTVLTSDVFSNFGMVFKKSDYKFKGESTHGSIPEVYVREVLAGISPSNRLDKVAAL